MRFEVPQFIEVEDKIFGPLTWRQFLYLGGGIGIGVALFITAPFIIFVIFGIPLMGLAGALAFYPINNRPFSFFLEALVEYLRKQKLYLWRRDEEAVHKYNFTPAAVPDEAYSPIHQTPKKQIASLARRLELEALEKK